jgi:FkbM family methyltransferase
MKAIYLPDVPFRSLYVPEILKEIYIDKVFNKLQKCNVIMDVGANIGLTAMFLRDHCNKVYAIEPSPEHFQALTENKTKNDWGNVEVFNLAMSHKKERATFYQDDWNRTTHSLCKRSGNSLTVECTTFADFMAENKIDQVDFCKLDVEGAEEPILRGEGFMSVAPRIKNLLIEFHEANRVTGIINHMVTLGYNWENVPANAIIYWFERP